MLDRARNRDFHWPEYSEKKRTESTVVSLRAARIVFLKVTYGAYEGLSFLGKCVDWFSLVGCV
jgi:hypothetical protein